MVILKILFQVTSLFWKNKCSLPKFTSLPTGQMHFYVYVYVSKNRKFPITTQLKMKGEKWATLSLFPVADMNANKHVSFGFKGKRRRNYHMFLVCSSTFCLDMFGKDKPDLMNVFFFWRYIQVKFVWIFVGLHLSAICCLPDFGLQRQTRLSLNMERWYMDDTDDFAWIWIYGCFLKWWYPQIIHFNRLLLYKPSIFGSRYFWKHPYRTIFVWINTNR